MPLPTKVESARQKAFIRELASGTPCDAAAEMAGYSDRSALWNLLNAPSVAREVERGVRARLATVYGPEAMAVLHALATSAETHPAIRRAAAKDIVSLAGYVAPKAADALADDKSIASMSADELSQLVNKMEGELASRAKDVSAPNAPDVDSELLDMYS